MEKDAKKLLEKYLSGDCTPEEIAVVEDWYIQLPFEGKTPTHARIEESKQATFALLNQVKKLGHYSLIKVVGIAASILICLTVGIYLFKYRTQEKVLVTKRHLKDILPGRNRAVLKLADGSTVDLDQAKNGEIAIQNGIIIRKNANGELEYIIKDSASGISGSNQVSTPRGGQYQVSLPDGTKVWLNAASTLKYPYSFAVNERLVELNGEAYFEVSKDRKRPFRVNTGKQTVEVLGTHFNINAYSDEAAIRTTLLEGAVRVSTASAKVDIHPGEQSKFPYGSSVLSVDKNVDLDRVMAWKNDVFSFDNDDLKTVMRQIARWYDLDVVYKGKIGEERYVGEIPRSSNLAEVFKILELNHVLTEINGKTLTISGN